MLWLREWYLFFFKGEEGIRDDLVTGVQTCALPILLQQRDSFHPARQPHDSTGQDGRAELSKLAYAHPDSTRSAAPGTGGSDDRRRHESSKESAHSGWPLLLFTLSPQPIRTLRQNAQNKR